CLKEQPVLFSVCFWRSITLQPSSNSIYKKMVRVKSTKCQSVVPLDTTCFLKKGWPLQDAEHLLGGVGGRSREMKGKCLCG
uniref:Uncharacterized protein n=1 Tax=Chrysemys picta bellii TaxID=8478 RepID=A0A8C3IJ13_CHRPI